jgi:ectoine hydroxylase-related dioxygenase (phytanoyl-CoA dioxygenase family)
MIKNYQYDIEKYNFVGLFEGLFVVEDGLSQLHTTLDKQYDFFDSPGKDSDTVFHRVFYDKMRSSWPEFLNLYKKFIKEVIAPIVGAEDKIIYQTWPSFRVHLPDNVAVGGWHCDGDYNHPKGEMNFILALTPMFESNTTIAESEPGKKDFRQIEIDPGGFAQFDGNRCTHGNLPNRTGVTRVSFDFRVMRYEDYNSEHELLSLSKGNKFIIGDYYQLMELT